jgi:hypothetical protein
MKLSLRTIFVLFCLLFCLCGWGVTWCVSRHEESAHRKEKTKLDRERARREQAHQQDLARQKRRYESRLARARSLAAPQPDSVYVEKTLPVKPVEKPLTAFSTQITLAADTAARRRLERMPLIEAIDRQDHYLAVTTRDTAGRAVTQFFDAKVTLANFRLNSAGQLETDPRSVRAQKFKNTVRDIKMVAVGVGTAVVAVVVYVVASPK